MIEDVKSASTESCFRTAQVGETGASEGEARVAKTSFQFEAAGLQKSLQSSRSILADQIGSTLQVIRDWIFPTTRINR